MFLLFCQPRDGDLEEKEKCVLAGRGQKTSRQDRRQGKQRHGDETSTAQEKDVWREITGKDEVEDTLRRSLGVQKET